MKKGSFFFFFCGRRRVAWQPCLLLFLHSPLPELVHPGNKKGFFELSELSHNHTHTHTLIPRAEFFSLPGPPSPLHTQMRTEEEPLARKEQNVYITKFYLLFLPCLTLPPFLPTTTTQMHPRYYCLSVKDEEDVEEEHRNRKKEREIFYSDLTVR